MADWQLVAYISELEHSRHVPRAKRVNRYNSRIKGDMYHFPSVSDEIILVSLCTPCLE